MKFLVDISVLRLPGLRNMWFAQTLMAMSIQMSVIGVPVQLYSYTHVSATFAIGSAIAMLGAVFCGLCGGVLTDIFDRRIILYCTTFLLSVCAILQYISSLAIHNVWIIILIYFLQSSIYAIYQPARVASVANLASRDNLPDVISLMMSVFQLTALIGPMIGGIILSFIGVSGLYLIDAICCLLTAFFMLGTPSMPSNNNANPPSEDTKSTFTLTNITDGFRYVLSQKAILCVFVIDMIATLFGMSRALFPQIAHQNLGGPPTGGFSYGLLSAAFAAGAFLGGILSRAVMLSHKPILGMSCLAAIWGGCIAIFGWIISYLHGLNHGLFSLALLFLALGGMADMAASSVRSAVSQLTTSETYRGRVQSISFIIITIGPRGADFLHGILAGIIGVAPTIIVGGILVSALVFILFLTVPTIRTTLNLQKSSPPQQKIQLELAELENLEEHNTI